MLSYEIKDKLKKNWGDMADALECFAEVKFIDKYSKWCCYIYAMEPGNEDNVKVFIPLCTSPLCEWSLQELYSCHDLAGEPLVIDKEYRRMKVKDLVRRFGNDT